jgi:FKBP-type peptidyl-prolyl cis-trans isomerase
MVKRILAVALVIGMLSCGMVFAAGKELKTPDEKLSYILGTDVGRSLKSVPQKIDLEIFLQGIKDSFKGEKLLVTEEESAQIKQEFMKKIQAEAVKKMEEISEKNKREGEMFLAENKKKEGVITTASGLQYIVLKQGDGALPKVDDKVKVHYRGTLIDGTEFDSSYTRGEPVSFPLGGVIKGWTEALQLMKVGSKYRLFIPSELAYGERGAGTQIGPNTILIFEVELLAIEK